VTPKSPRTSSDQGLILSWKKGQAKNKENARRGGSAQTMNCAPLTLLGGHAATYLQEKREIDEEEGGQDIEIINDKLEKTVKKGITHKTEKRGEITN